MKKILLLTLTMLFVVTCFNAQEYDILNVVGSDKENEEIVPNASFFRINGFQLSKLRKDDPERILVPVKRGLELELFKREVTTKDFKVSTSKQSKYSKIKPSVIYSGQVIGDSASFAVLSINSKNELSGIIKTKGETLTVGQVEKNKTAIIDESVMSMPTKHPLEGDALEIPKEERPQGYNIPVIRNSQNNKCKTIEVYFEVEHGLYKSKKNVQSTVDYVVGLFSVVQRLYEEIGIYLKISEIKVHTSGQKYKYGASSEALHGFSNEVKNKGMNGDIGHLLANENGGLGGIAYVGVLCSSERFKVAFSNVSTTFKEFPTYSWSVAVVAHEIGHNIGSRHTQWCGWEGGALDNCYKVEGNCSPGPEPIDGGTIMSYCHLKGTGINFNKGFHPQVKDKLVASVNNASCIKYDDDSDCKTINNDELPDLVRVSDFIDVKEGSISLKVKMRNQGKKSTIKGAFGIFLSNDRVLNSTDAQILKKEIPVLKPSEEYEISIELNKNEIDVEPGEYFVSYMLDMDDHNEEQNESNNIYFWSTKYTVLAANEYCSSYGESTGYEAIGKVILNEHQNESNDNDGYGDFTGNPIRISAKTKQVQLQLHPIYFTSSKFREQWKIWIDFNKNFKFEDDELVFEEAKRGNVEGSFDLPNSLPDSARMRVSMKYIMSNKVKLEPCEIFSYGEVEDYTLIFNADEECPNPKLVYLASDLLQNKSFVKWNTIDVAKGYFVEYKFVGSKDWVKKATDKDNIPIPSNNFEFRIRSSCNNEHDKDYVIKIE